MYYNICNVGNAQTKETFESIATMKFNIYMGLCDEREEDIENFGMRRSY
jgi:hypothetical protein